MGKLKVTDTKDVIKLLDRRQKILFGKKYRYTNVSIIKWHCFKEHLKNYYNEEELGTLLMLLKHVVEETKHFSPTQTVINAIVTMITAFLISILTFSSGIMSTMANLLANYHLNKDEVNLDQKEKIVRDVSKIFPKLSDLVLDMLYQPAFYIVIFILLVIAVYTGCNQRKMNRAVFYKEIIEQCINEKKEAKKGSNI
jgi:hypothetical protein